MKIIVVGGTGTIGRAVVDQLKPRHEVVVVGMSSGEFQVDIRDVASIEKMYQAIGSFDALVSTVGKVKFAPLAEMTADSYAIGLQDKLMGQVNLVLIGLKHINPKGSFTLTSGILSDDPIVYGSSAAMVNAALNGFVKSSAIEMPVGVRINVISPTVLEESLDAYGDYFLGFEAVKASRVALAYSKSVEGAQTGQVYNVW
ncbi:MAG: short chain dehydrogenase [Gammaproteobacteria bacterium]